MVPLYLAVDSSQEEAKQQQEEEIDASGQRGEGLHTTQPTTAGFYLHQWVLPHTEAASVAQHAQGHLDTHDEQQ